MVVLFGAICPARGIGVALVLPFANAEMMNGSVKNLGRYAASWIAWWPKRPSSTAALT